jgi:hypothetical protein
LATGGSVNFIGVIFWFDTAAMAEDKVFHPIRWTVRFMRTDAEQPVRTARMALSTLRANQWILFEWKKLEQKSRFYVFKKKEVLPKFKDVSSDLPVVRALSLKDKPSSQVFESRPDRVLVPSNTDAEQPWLPRKVLLDDVGNPVAIGVPVIPSDSVVLRRHLKPPVDRNQSIGFSLELQRPSDEPREYSIVKIFYGTDRSRIGGRYSNEREPADTFHFGTCEVTIPCDHRLSALESPKWWKFEFSWNPAKHVVLQQINELQKHDFFDTLGSDIRESGTKSAFVFIHGFDSSFDDAARRTGQIDVRPGLQRRAHSL